MQDMTALPAKSSHTRGSPAVVKWSGDSAMGSDLSRLAVGSDTGSCTRSVTGSDKGPDTGSDTGPDTGSHREEGVVAGMVTTLTLLLLEP